MLIMSMGRDEPCPCESGRKYKHCCLLHEPREEQAKVLWEQVFAPGLRELMEARLRAIFAHEPETEPLILEAFIASGLELQCAESARVRIVAEVMAVTPHVWGHELGEELGRRVPVASLSPGAQVVAQVFARSRLGVWDVFERDDGRILVESVAAFDGERHEVVARLRSTDPAVPTQGVTSVGWLASLHGAPVYIEHLGLDLNTADKLVFEGLDHGIVGSDDLPTEEADLELVRLAIKLHIVRDPALDPPSYPMSGIAERVDYMLRDPETQNGVVGRTLEQLIRPGPPCEALLRAETEEALLSAVSDARWRGDSLPRVGPRDPELESVLERRVPAPAILETIHFSGDVIFEEERRLASLPVALLGVAERARSERARTGGSIQTALEAASGRARTGGAIQTALEAASDRAREELDAAWRTFCAEQRGLRLLAMISRVFSKAGLRRALSYEFARWILLDIAPDEVGDTPLGALPMSRGPLDRLLAGLHAAYDLPPEPRLRDLPATYRELEDLEGVGAKSQEALVTALTDHLRDWRCHRAGLTPEQLLGDLPRDPEAAAALKAGLTDLETLFT